MSSQQPPQPLVVDALEYAPVAAVLASAGKADESIPDPKGRESRTPRTFPCKSASFRGPPEGAMIAIVDPLQADAVMAGKYIA